MSEIFNIRNYGDKYKNLSSKECVICQRIFSYPTYMDKSIATCCKYCASLLLSWKKRSGIYKLCDTCNKPVWVMKNKIKSKQNKTYCSVKCKDIGWSIYSSERNGGVLQTGRKKYYGGNWLSQRRKARKRDNYCCKRCGINEEKYGKELSVHHITPFVYFEKYEEANRLENLLSLCEPCHRKEHSGENHHYKFEKDKIVFNNELNTVTTSQREKAITVVNLLLNTEKTLKQISCETGLSYTGVSRIYKGERWCELYEIAPRDTRKIKKAKI